MDPDELSESCLTHSCPLETSTLWQLLQEPEAFSAEILVTPHLILLWIMTLHPQPSSSALKTCQAFD